MNLYMIDVFVRCRSNGFAYYLNDTKFQLDKEMFSLKAHT